MSNKIKTRKKYYLKITLCFTLILLSIFPLTSLAEAKSISASKIIVSLGDSYSSGEGIEKFYGQDKKVEKKVSDSDWLAHRSKNSWPGMLTLPGVKGTMADYHGKNSHWYFVAASGAKIIDLEGKQEKEYKQKYNSSIEIEGSKKLDPQLDIFDKLEKQGKKADYVTITIGGNDAEFAEIINSAAKRSAYFHVNNVADKLNHVWYQFYKDYGIKYQLAIIYERISRKAGEQADIIVAGYPLLFSKLFKPVYLSFYEINLINDSVHVFNEEIKEIVKNSQKRGFKIHYVSVEKEFDGHGAYAWDPFINKIMLRQKEDINISKLHSDYSVHPNLKGAKAYAKCVQRKINEIEKDRQNSANKSPSNKSLSMGDLQELLTSNTWKREYDVQVSGVQFLDFYTDGKVKYSTPDRMDDLVYSTPYYYEAMGTYSITQDGNIKLNFGDQGVFIKTLFVLPELEGYCLVDVDSPSWEDYGSYITDFYPVK